MNSLTVRLSCKLLGASSPGTPLVVKASWQYPEREEQGQLLHKATEKQVKNVAGYFHYETARVGG